MPFWKSKKKEAQNTKRTPPPPQSSSITINDILPPLGDLDEYTKEIFMALNSEEGQRNPTVVMNRYEQKAMRSVVGLMFNPSLVKLLHQQKLLIMRRGRIQFQSLNSLLSSR